MMHRINTNTAIVRGDTHRDHLDTTHVERLVLLSTRRLYLNVVPWPATMPHGSLFGAKPLARELSARILIRKVRIGRPAERRKTGNTVSQLARPIVRPKVDQHPVEHLVHLYADIISVLSIGACEVREKTART